MLKGGCWKRVNSAAMHERPVGAWEASTSPYSFVLKRRETMRLARNLLNCSSLHSAMMEPVYCVPRDWERTNVVR